MSGEVSSALCVCVREREYKSRLCGGNGRVSRVLSVGCEGISCWISIV